MTQNAGLQHYSLRQRIYRNFEKFPHPNSFKRFYDDFIYIMVAIAPLINIPQLITVWVDKDTSGVSTFSWFGFSFVSITWLIYGLVHKDKHIIIMNFLLMIVQTLIAIGTLIY